MHAPTTDSIEMLTPEKWPWELLLLADPSRSKVEGYISRSLVLGYREGDSYVGVVVITPMGEGVCEIMNIAVSESHQGRGIGKLLIHQAIQTCAQQGIQRIELGTGNSSLTQLGLYQKLGFRIVGIDRDFFTRNYNDPIIENGIQCRDMVRLAMVLPGK